MARGQTAVSKVMADNLKTALSVVVARTAKLSNFMDEEYVSDIGRLFRIAVDGDPRINGNMVDRIIAFYRTVDVERYYSSGDVFPQVCNLLL
jgi:hypothetical protein